jgi:PPOX class probable F420-dependent enzyme
MAGDKSVSLLSAEVRRLASLPIITVLATQRRDESIQLNPIWFELDGDEFVINSNTRRTWPANLQREGEAVLLLVDPENTERYAQIRGRMVDVKPDADLAVINRLARRYTGKKFRALEPGEERITLRIAPVKITGQMI